MDPGAVYKTPAWHAYRPSMVALGLIKEGSGFGLTDAGAALSKAWWKAVHPNAKQVRPLPEKACLSRVSPGERRLLRDLLGFSLRGKLAPESEDPRVTRAAFMRKVREIYWQNGLSPETVLPRYEKLGARNLQGPARVLRTAAVWEWLCLGLNTLFVAWVRAIETGQRSAFERMAASRLAGRRPCPRFHQIEMTGPDQEHSVGSALAALQRALELHDRLVEREGAFADKDVEDGFEIARALLKPGQKAPDRVEQALRSLLERHFSAKGDEAWLRTCGGDKLEVARDAGHGWKVPTTVRPHAYRMTAFSQIARDLGGI